MARRKIYPHELNDHVSDKDDIRAAEAGDFCYFLDGGNKICWGEIKRVYTENKILGFSIVCQTEYRHYSVPAAFCSFDKKALKGKKRVDYTQLKC
tara:strand:+ start:3321 stop:3605 length:285 start_codon:yes stop_codon:yes gene_type:complete